MKMKATIIAIVMMASSITVLAEADAVKSKGYPSMPPTFSLEAESHSLLSSYPLSVIDKKTAFSHHGSSHKNVTLVNGLEGWVYEIHRGGNPKQFKQPDGKKVTTMDIQDHPAAASYTLVFGGSGNVIDVLYRDIQHGNVNSALLIQRETSGDKPNEKSFPAKR